MPDRFPSATVNTTFCTRCDRRPGNAEVFEECAGCEAQCCQKCMTVCETCDGQWCRVCLKKWEFYEGICRHCCDRVEEILEEE